MQGSEGRHRWWLGVTLAATLTAGSVCAEEPSAPPPPPPDPAQQLLDDYVQKVEQERRAKEQEVLGRVAQRKMTIDRLLAEGQALFDAGNREAAILKWQEVLKYDPENVEAATRIKVVQRDAAYEAQKKQDVGNTIDVTAKITEAKDLYGRQLFEDAIDRLEDALKIDPWNHEAQRLIREIRLEKQARGILKVKRDRLGRKGENEVDKRETLSYGDGLRETPEGFDPRGINVQPKEEPNAEELELAEMTEAELALREKLQQKVSLDFEDEDLREVVKHLSKVTSITIMVDPDIFLETGAPAEVAPADLGGTGEVPELGEETPAPAAETEAEQFLPEGSFEEGLDLSDTSMSGGSSGGKISPIVTIFAEDVPMESAMKLLLGPKKLDYKIVEDVIFISNTEGVEDMAARYEGMVEEVYHLEFGVPVRQKVMARAFGSVRSGSGGGGGGGGEGSVGWGDSAEQQTSGMGAETMEGGAGDASTSMVVKILEQLTPQPQGASMILYSDTSTLIVKNTPTNQRKIKALLSKLDQLPKQVLIEARFITVSDEIVRRIGVQWTSGRDYNDNGYITYDEQLIQDNSDSHQYRMYTDTGTFPVSQGNGTWLSFPEPQMNVPEGFFERVASSLNFSRGMSFSWTHLNEPQFTAMINMLEATGGFETLSAPKVTTMSNEPALIRLVTTITYASDVDVNTTTSGTGGTTSGIITRDIEYQFVERDVGIILNVTPQVSEARRTVRLFLQPVISDIVGSDSFTISGGGEGGDVVLSIPRFRSRDVTTNAVISDGETLVLGGLVVNMSGNVTRTIPFLGEIPLLGWLFKSEQKEESKNNLLIFVTVHILDFQGARLYDQMDEKMDASMGRPEDAVKALPEIEALRELGVPIEGGVQPTTDKP